MRELDELLVRYLENRYEDADERDKSAFRSVLELSDPELNGYFLQRQSPPSQDIAVVIAHILELPPG